MNKIFGFFLIAVFISACGYKPSVRYAREALGERIHVEVSISRKDPKNSVVIKDAVNEAVITRLGGKLSSKELADTHLNISIGSTTFSAILYDVDGYVVSYKALVSLKTKYTTKDGKSESFSTTGEYDFPIEANSIISDSKRFEAIKLASLDALNEFISKIAIKGMK
ncbi:LPS assembly lipoprotein LptE [Sulfurospirillum arcachonense]|uniref:LPS assembly lipoprotein LptE n=1 Tax=Sulfurospirillum arcachonense TaxID=57666 RepID=UPI0004693531|nr:LPS assembly lipoprotein LptE [Sulfurospirillum arcachonense]